MHEIIVWTIIDFDLKCAILFHPLKPRWQHDESTDIFFRCVDTIEVSNHSLFLYFNSYFIVISSCATEKEKNKKERNKDKLSIHIERNNWRKRKQAIRQKRRTDRHECREKVYNIIKPQLFDTWTRDLILNMKVTNVLKTILYR